MRGKEDVKQKILDETGEPDSELLCTKEGTRLDGVRFGQVVGLACDQSCFYHVLSCSNAKHICRIAIYQAHLSLHHTLARL